METIERIQAGRALLNRGADSATAGVLELMRPPAVTEDPTTGQDEDVGFSPPNYLVGKPRGYTKFARRVEALTAPILQAMVYEGVTVVGSSTAVFNVVRNLDVVGVHAVGWLDAFQTLNSSCISGATVLMGSTGADLVVSPFDRIAPYKYMQLKLLIDGIGTIYKVRFEKPLNDRLTSLCDAWKEENEAGEAPSPESLSGLLRFLSSTRTVRLPSIVLSPHGNWIAEWRLDARNLFSAHFLDEVNVRFVSVVASDGSLIRRTSQVWGEIEIGKLLATARTYDADQWVCE